jgi:hypothetical protein
MARGRMQDAGVVLTATNTVIAELAQNWSSPEGQQLIQLLFTEVLPAIEPAAATLLQKAKSLVTGE